MVTSPAYNADNRPITETDAVGTAVQRTEQSSYNAVGDVLTTTDALGKVTTYSYNALDEQIAATDPLGHTTSTSYDPVGDVLTTTDALGNVTTNVYDVLHRQIAVIDPLGDTTTMVLNADGDQVATIDGNGNVSGMLVAINDDTIGSVDALGNVTQVVLDPNGNIRAVIDPDGNETSYVLDNDGNVAETITPTGTTTSVYDAEHRLTQMTDPDGRVIQYSYDNDDELTGEVWKNNSGVTVNIQTYTYDNDGNMLTGADYNGTVTYTYDALDRVQTYTNVFGQVLTYSYNADDDVTQRTDSLGGVLTYVYDNAGRLTSEQFAGTGPTGTAVRVDFGYNNRDDQTTITWYSNLAGTATVVQSAYHYDNADRLTSIVNKNGSGTVLSAYTYTYDQGDRVTSQQHWSEVGTTVYSGTNTYTYDADNQLLSDGTTTYSYDANGNRTMTGYATGTNNEMTNDGTYTYTYDNAGNLIEKSTGTGVTWVYSYDNENHLTGVQEASAGATIVWSTFTYDVTGNMVAEQDWTSTGGTTTTHFAYDLDGNMWTELDGSNNLLVRQLYDPATNQILTRTEASGANAGASAYLTDDQGSVRDLVNWSGQVVDHLDYTGYGVVTESTPLVGDQFKYAGMQFIAPVGWYYDFARWYIPTDGVFTEIDPISFASGQANLYDYVANDPTNAIDPTGLSAPHAGGIWRGSGQWIDSTTWIWKEGSGSYAYNSQTKRWYWFNRDVFPGVWEPIVESGSGRTNDFRDTIEGWLAPTDWKPPPVPPRVPALFDPSSLLPSPGVHRPKTAYPPVPGFFDDLPPMGTNRKLPPLPKGLQPVAPPVGQYVRVGSQMGVPRPVPDRVGRDPGTGPAVMEDPFPQVVYVPIPYITGHFSGTGVVDSVGNFVLRGVRVAQNAISPARVVGIAAPGSHPNVTALGIGVELSIVKGSGPAPR